MIAPPSASSKLSVSNWPTNRIRLAPSAERIAISFSRAVARASSMFATLLHGDARLELRLEIPVIAVGARVAALHRPNDPKVCAQLGEARRHNPDQRRRRPIESETLA